MVSSAIGDSPISVLEINLGRLFSVYPFSFSAVLLIQ